MKNTQIDLNKYSKISKRLLKRLSVWWRKAVRWLKKIAKRIITNLKKRFTSWWQIALITIGAIVFLYYPVGGMLINKIDTESYQAENQNDNLFVVDTLNYLINREVHHHIWTPNLPFLFPSYFLDNMPNFQMGIISAVSHTASGLAKMNYTTASPDSVPYLTKAAELLKYSPTVWLPATSSNTQYKKGRRQLRNFNDELASGKVLLPRTSTNFAIILSNINRDLAHLINTTSEHIREHQTDWLDFSADDVFYYAYGKLYAYLQITKNLSSDFKDVLVKYDIYQQWTSLISLLDQAVTIRPLIVRNGSLDSIFAPNHLAYLNNQTAQATNYLNIIIYKLQKQ